MVPVAFMALIGIGAFLLRLPFAHQADKSISWLDSLFLATSATCVTGLTTVNVAEIFNGFGQAVLLGLIQLGGLGIFTASILLVLLSGQKLSLADEHTIHATVGKLRNVRPVDVFIYACLFVFLIEFAGTVALFLQLNNLNPYDSFWQNLWEAAFHSVSAFCNAGISIFPDNLEPWRNHPGLLGTIEILVIAGGIGLMTLINLRYYYFWRRDPRRRGYLTLQTKLSLFMAALFLIGGTLVTLAFEYARTPENSSLGQDISRAFFHSTMSRTAGFNIVEVGDMQPPTLLGTLFLMFIGGSPGSMAGGVKTVTFAVLVLTAWSALRRQENIEVFGRRIPPQVAGRSVMIVLVATAVLMIGVGLLMVTEHGHAASETSKHWLAVVFEAVSAFGTVGLSTGITPLLTALGKTIIMLLMFIGRVMPLILSIYLARPVHSWHIRAPIEEVGLG